MCMQRTGGGDVKGPPEGQGGGGDAIHGGREDGTGADSREEGELSLGHVDGAGEGHPHGDVQQMLVFLSRPAPQVCPSPSPTPPPSSAGLTQASGAEPRSAPSIHLPFTVTLEPQGTSSAGCLGQRNMC